MGYLINYTTGEILGDEQQAKKELGLPYNNEAGRYVSQPEIDDNDKAGE